MRLVPALVAAAVLGASCTGDRPAPEARPAEPPGQGMPRCTDSPGRLPEGFVLVRTREFDYPDRIGVRKEYRHPDGRLLVHLVGVGGQQGEHATVADQVELASGKTATIFGDGESPNWSLAWKERPPCAQIAVVGNRFTREQFESAMKEAGLLPAHG